jgi:NhaD family Na+/H+ antiporter
MYTIVIVVFILGYLAITLEHSLKVNKTASALFTGIILWVIYAIGHQSEILEINIELSHHLGKITEILFFLWGAMTVVELIDAHQGFEVITDRIKTRNIKSLIWLVTIITFFLSAVLDNLTTTIVMVSFIRKLIPEQEQRKLFAGIIIIAANAGGAWSPMGDVTTTMLWIGGQISPLNIILQLFIPSLVCVLIPGFIFSRRINGNLPELEKESTAKIKGSKGMLFAGLGALIMVPLFKIVTHLPPYLGMLLGLAIVWLISEILHKDKEEEEKKSYSAAHALSRIDTSSILFFLGILVAVSCLESMGILKQLAVLLQNSVQNIDLVVFLIGLFSAIFDNVPLVAAAIGMYDLGTYPMDDKLWNFLAYCAGTGGSILIIGSAAGVAVMGMEKIDFFWYLKKVSLIALIGYVAGAACYMLITVLF